MEAKKFFNIKSRYIFHKLLTHISHVKALKLAIYNEKLKRELKISFNDYFIDCIFTNEYKAIGNDYILIKNEEKDNCFISYSIIIFKIIFIALTLINFNYWKTNFYNIYLIIDSIYKSINLVHFFMIKFFDTKPTESDKFLHKCNIIFNSVILIFLICKTVSDHKNNNNKLILLILNSIMIFICVVLIILFSINVFYCIDIYMNKSDKLEPKHKKEINVAIIKKFRGFKINEYKCTSLKAFGKFDKIDTGSIKKHSIYDLNKNQILLISKINKLRKKKNLNVLKYERSQYFNEFFTYYKKLNCIFYDINKLDNNSYLFIYPKNEFKKKISEKEKEIIDILSKDCFNHIMILEKDLNEYILIYYFYDKKQKNIEEEINYETESKNILTINNNI